MRISVLILFLFISVCPLWTQNDTITVNASRMQIGIGAGWQQNTVLDHFVSPMLYSGKGYGLHAGLIKTKEGRYDRLWTGYQNAWISPELKNDSQSFLNRGTVNWSRGWRLNDGNARIKFYTGGHLLAFIHATEHIQWKNNGFSYGFSLSAGPSILTGIPLSPNGKLNLDWEISFPLASYVIRPGISSLVPEGAIRHNNLGFTGYAAGGRLTAVHEHFYILSRMLLDVQIKDWLVLQMEYRWNYMHYRVNNKYQSASQLLGFSLILKNLK